MTDKDKQDRPILTLSGKNRPKINVTKDRPTLMIEKTKKDSVGTLNTGKEKTAISKPQAKDPENTTSPEPDAKPKPKTNPALATTPVIDYNFKAIYKELHTKFPNIINMNKPVLLAIAIRGEILKKVNVPNAVMYKWISWYFRKSNYYAIHEVGAMRYNLDGTEAGLVTKKDQAKREKQLCKNKNNNLNSEGSTQEKVISPTQRPKE
jgi:sRNA-binding protein